MKEECQYCIAGRPAIRMKRQYIHRIGWDNIVCKEQGFRYQPGTWTGHNPKDWVPRRLRGPYKVDSIKSF